MGTISFSPRAEDIWYVAGWVFRQLLDDVIQHYTDDQKLAETFADAKMYSSLILYRLEPSFAARIETSISNVVSGILAGTVSSGITQQPYGDEGTVQEYLESLEDLLRVLRASKSN